MKKIIILMLGVLPISVLLIGCSSETVEVVDEDGNLVGEAFRSAGKYQIKTNSYCSKLEKSCGFISEPSTAESSGLLECDTFWKPTITNGGEQVCESNGFDACVGIDISYQIVNGDILPFHSMHSPCDAFETSSDLELTMKEIVMEETFNVYDETANSDDYVQDVEWQVTCCKIS